MADDDSGCDEVELTNEDDEDDEDNEDDEDDEDNEDDEDDREDGKGGEQRYGSVANSVLSKDEKVDEDDDA
jgi:hypothetical protein